MFGIDKEFYGLLNSEALSKMESPIEELDAQFFQKYSDRIFYEPYQMWEASIVDQIEDIVNPNFEWYETSYILFKSFAMKFFINDLLEHCFITYKRIWTNLFLPDLVRSLTNEYHRLIKRKKEELDSYRDHILHSGMVFLFGLWLYFRFQPLREKHRRMLENNPQGTGKGCITHQKDVSWQFFQQWLITSFFHDIGRFIQGQENPKLILNKLDYINNIESQLIKEMKVEGYSNIPEQKTIGYNSKDKKLEINLYTINYPVREVEKHISNDMWQECLKEINQREESLQDNHGIHSSKILLKLANFSTKVAEIYDQNEVAIYKKEPWKLFSYRNYILPALAIANHNAPGWKKELDIPGEITIPLEMLEEDFLTTLISYCDALADFDRLGGTKINFAIEYEIKPIESGRAIKFNIIKSD